MSCSRSVGFFAALCWVALAVGLATPAAAGSAGARQGASLDGTWSFRLDPDGVGEEEGWFRPEGSFSDAIRVPGAWDAQGFGPETDKLRHNFIGKGWYSRTFEMPDSWKGRRVFVCFGGVYRAAKAWVNGEAAGTHLGYISNFEFDITPFVKAGEPNRMVVLVDSEQRWEKDALQGCMDVIDHLFTYWGGIWGHVSIEARSAQWIENLFIIPRIKPDTGCTVEAHVSGDYVQASAAVTVFGPEGGQVAAQRAPITEKGTVRIEVDLPQARLWSPETPCLYTIEVVLLDAVGQELDRVRERFGVRTIELRDTNFYVNGVKYYLAGYGDDCVYPETIAPPANKQFYLDRLRVAKEYGFNYVRHHSHFVAPEYYEACDEVGMFVSPELPIAYPRFYDRAHGPALELYKSEWAAAIKRYRNHPSIFDWCMANELWEGMPRVGPDLYRIAKELDPTRPVIDSDGVFPAGFIDGTKDRPTLDFLTVMFDILTTPLDNPEKFRTGKPLKPMITHEEGNYVHFPRLDEIELYRDNFKPFWLTDCRDRVERAGLIDEAPAWAEASQKLYGLCHKANIEALRKNPYISGYHWWLLQPWYVGSNGLLDTQRRPISITPEYVRRFNAPVVLLQEGIARTYRGNDVLKCAILLSNYSGSPIDNGTVRVTVSCEGQTIEDRLLPLSTLANGEIGNVGTVCATLPDPAQPQRVRVNTALVSEFVSQVNDWVTWVYPSKTPKPVLDSPLYATPDLARLLKPFGATPMPEGEVLPVRSVYVAHQPTEALVHAAEQGGCVVLLSPAGVFPTDCSSYKPAWWLGVFDGDSNAGTFVYDNPVTRGLAPEGWCDASWFCLLQGAQTFLLDNLPKQPEVLIRALNTHGAPHPFSRQADFEYVWRNKALLMQVKVGKGTVILSGLNFDLAAYGGGPEGEYVLARLIEHAGRFPQPSEEWPAEFLRDAVARSPFTKGPVLSGYSRLTDLKGEEAVGQTCRELSTDVYRIRQEEPMHHIAWETAPAPKALPSVFVFAGGFPFMAPPEANPGFTLFVNGQRVLDFDTSKTETCWHGEDGRVALLYVPGHVRPSWNETAGLFYISVSPEFVTPGRPCAIEVRSRGSDNKRWFGLHPYADMASGFEEGGG